MAAKREIDNLFCIFNLSIRKALHLDQSLFTKVLFVYDKGKNRKEIKILHEGMTEEIRRRLASWLEDNVEVDDIIHKISHKEINIDDLKKASNY
jgi:hypothetical protein